jgi:hypothetical protein
LLLLLSALGAASGCAARERIQPGLANGPRLGGDTPVITHDAIANAADSCPSREGGRDPLAHRFNACPGAHEAPPRVVLFGAKVDAPPKSKATRYNFHLEGLPPCERSSDAWVSAESGPLCAR